MLGFEGIVLSPKDALSVFPAMIDIIKRLQKKDVKDPTLQQIVQEFRFEAIENCKRLRMELVVTMQDLVTKGLDPKKSLSGIYQELNWMLNPINKRSIKNHRDNINKIHQNLLSATDDFTAVLTCLDKTSGLSEAYESSARTRRDLDGMISNDSSFHDVMNIYIKQIDGYLNALEA